MRSTINIFNSMEYLEPKCPKCSSVIKYGITTKFDEKRNAHICNKCGSVLE